MAEIAKRVVLGLGEGSVHLLTTKCGQWSSHVAFIDNRG